MDYGNLKDLLSFVEYGTNLKISVLFFNSYDNEHLKIPYEKTVHLGAVCSRLKSFHNGYEKCFSCRNAVIKKAVTSKKAFGGLCVNGIYEYVSPVVYDDDVVGIIFIGNILPDGKDSELIRKSIDDVELLETMEKNFSYEKCPAIAGVIEGYIKLVLNLFHLDVKADRCSQLIQDLKVYIEESLECKIDLTTLSKVFHYNRKYLGRLFKQKTSYNVSDYINSRRMVRAKMLLTETDDSVIDISEKIGFNNVTYFNRLFKKEYKVSPTVYRQKYRLK